MMTNKGSFFALCAAVVSATIACISFAQDDLDNLLKDLEGETKAKPAEAAAPAAAEPVAAAPAAEEAKPVEEVKSAPEAPKAEEKAEEPAKAEENAEAEKPAEVAKAEEKADEAKPAEEAKAEEPAAAEEPKAKVVREKSAAPQPDSELLSNVATTERLRRQALDAQAKREIVTARECMDNEEYGDAVRHYALASKFLSERGAVKNLRRECDQGIAEGLYRESLQEDALGRRAHATELMTKALEMRHPKASRVLAKWRAEEATESDADTSDMVNIALEDKSKKERAQIRKHLKRGHQYLAMRDLTKALDEVEIVLVNDPYNQEAIRLRGAIQKKRQTILRQEREAARDGMIADVDEAWRPVYAVNAAQLSETASETVKQQTGEDPERTQEQDIENRMKAMRLPTISFKPPATIMDAVEFFRQASVDYDRPDIPVEKRGFNFVLKTPQPLKAAAEPADEGGSNDFSGNGEESTDSTPANGLSPIPTITASDITFYEALKLVCDSVDYKFIVRGPVVMVMHKDMSTAELLSRKYDVLEAFLERMTSASSDVKEMKASGFGGGSKKGGDEGEENQERDWKAFFEQMGVKWPEGSSIMYIKTLGKLYVRNTRENLAEFEKVLQEMGSQPKLIEIETRFVEVSQEDLNSLGFEWIMNSDYSLDLGNGIGRALGLSESTWGKDSGSQTWSSDSGSSTLNASKSVTGYDVGSNGAVTPLSDAGSTIRNEYTQSSGNAFQSTFSHQVNPYSVGGSLVRDDSGNNGLGVNAFGGTSSYQNGNRYLSTEGNHISGEGNSTNDQFMRVNAFLGSADLSMILHMLSQRSDTDLLSAPKVVTKSGENAVIKVVTEYIYPQDYDVQLQSSTSSGGSSSSGGSGSSSAILAVVEPQNFTMREVGVILDVTPTYSEANGGTIDLELKPQVVDEPWWKNYGMRIPFTGNPSNGFIPDLSWLTTLGTEVTSKMTSAVSSLIDQNSSTIAASYVNAGISSMNPSTLTYYDATMEQPMFPVRSIDSKVSITPGATVVMGGLITESRKAMDDKVPFLGDLPFIGRLFRSHSEQTIKKNLLIFVTGRLITPAGRELQVGADAASDEAEVKAAPEAE